MSLFFNFMYLNTQSHLFSDSSFIQIINLFNIAKLTAYRKIYIKMIDVLENTYIFSYLHLHF